MNTQQIDTTRTRSTRLNYMQIIDNAMHARGNVDWESVELISHDSSDLGDVIYKFSDTHTNQKYRIHIKCSSLGEKTFHYELFAYIKEKEWRKVVVDAKKLH